MYKRIAALLSPLLIAAGLFAFHPSASGQGNPTCPTRPVNDDSNACASTAYVTNQINVQAATQLSPIDIYLAIGDSNAVGQGSAGSSPSPNGIVLEYCANGTIQTANDPVCSAVTAAQNANTGSFWPSLGIAYNRPIGIVQAGVSGSTQASACDLGVGNGNWQVTTPGSNYQNSLTAINAALSAFIAAGYQPVFKGIIVILGNNDGLQINNGACTSAQYTTALTAMVANYRAATIGGKVNAQLPIYLPIIGTSSATIDAGYQQVRSAQQIFASITSNVSIPYAGVYSFGGLGLLQPSSAHPTQTGYNIWGTAMGAALNPQIPTINPYTLFTANSAVGGNAISGTIVQVVGANASPSIVVIDAYGGIPQVVLRRADTTLLSPTVIQNNDVLGVFGTRGYGNDVFGNNTNNGALLFQATQAFTTTTKGTQACIYTTANGANAPTCNLTIGQGGNVSASVLSAQALSAITISSQGLFVVPNGNVGVGSSTVPDAPLTVNTNNGATSIAPPTGTVIHAIGADGVNTDFIFDNYANGAGSSNLFFARGTGGTRASPVALPAASVPFAIFAQGFDGVSANRNLASIDLLNINQTAPSDAGGQIRLRTTATGTTNFAQRVLISSGVMIGPITTDPGQGVVVLSPQAFSNLTSCTTAIRGALAEVSDSNTTTWGATISGSSTHEVMAHCNGSNWTVMGD